MNNPWEFGWDAVGAIFGVLAFVGFIIAEWEKINKFVPKLISYFLIFLLMAVVGYTLAQSSMIWRLVSLVIAVLYGALVGAGASEMESPHNKNILVLVVIVGITGTIIGLWLANTLTHLW